MSKQNTETLSTIGCKNFSVGTNDPIELPTLADRMKTEGK